MFERAIAELAEARRRGQPGSKAQAQRLSGCYVAEDAARVVEVARARSFEEPSLKCEAIGHRFEVRPKRAILAAVPVEKLERVQHSASIGHADEVRPRAIPAAMPREEFL